MRLSSATRSSDQGNLELLRKDRKDRGQRTVAAWQGRVI